jgi:hypothetical protein
MNPAKIKGVGLSQQAKDVAISPAWMLQNKNSNIPPRGEKGLGTHVVPILIIKILIEYIHVITT